MFSWLVENELNEKFSINYDTDSWLKVAEADSKTIYAYKETVDAYKSEKDMELPPIFTQIDISVRFVGNRYYRIR